MKRSPRTKCRRSGCDHPLSYHSQGPRLPGSPSCTEGCGCVGFIGPDDVAKPPRKAASTSERLAAEAYTAGILDAAPGQPFTLQGQKLGATLGRAAAAHAKGADGQPLRGADVAAWYRATARAFRAATDAEPQYWGGWQPFYFEKWLNMGRRAMSTSGGRTNMLQPAPENMRVKSMRLGELK